ncbi:MULTISPECIES: hypothetical protein [unclassified Chryseobacterium]|uniref:hypothetical protein n=1 Tax=unclassified Chryseobacterium TaxID=2593645 RepID=UPI001AE8742E|nr:MULTISPECIES: hypothetical protein [unclassified Chryseobacterium]MBP1164829.1 hypothetical protein [Chryseobacterium sp. PvR013]MDR4890828.1 hypothetical protein [Chryseobacterium sp. CFS7]
MKTKLYSLMLACATLPLFSQVGINTATPSATLDVNGTMKVRDTPAATALPGYQVLAINQGTTQVYSVDPALLIAASGTNTSVYAAKKTTGISLLSVGAFPASFQPVNFLAADRNIGSSALFSDSDGAYNIPSTGVYAVGFAFRYGTGLQASLLSGTPGIGIARTRTGVSTIIDSRPFSGVNLALAVNLTLSDSSIHSLYSFQAGDKVSFGLTDAGVFTVGLLGSSIASFYIYKVSN